MRHPEGTRGGQRATPKPAAGYPADGADGLRIIQDIRGMHTGTERTKPRKAQQI